MYHCHSTLCQLNNESAVLAMPETERLMYGVNFFEIVLVV